MNARVSRWLPLGAAALLLPFANGVDSVPLAAWLAPVAVMRLSRTLRAGVGLPLAGVLLALANAVQFRGMVPLSGAPYYAMMASVGLVALTPYALDRWLGPRLDDGVGRLLLFPATATALQFLVSWGPFGTWGTAAYSQYGNQPLVQLASVTGLWGLDFLIFAAAPIANRVWERGWRAPSSLRALGAFAAVVGLVLLGGGLRLALSAPASRSVRIAALSRADVASQPGAAEWRRLSDGEPTAADRAVFTTWANDVADDLLSRADREAAAGARLILWDETGVIVLAENEAALLARGAELAARRHVFVGMGLGVWTIGRARPLQNELVLLDPEGRIVWTYHKAHPVFGSESLIVAPGDGKLPRTDTPFGRLSAIICADADHARLLAQAGAMHADIVLDPSNDWREIDPWHTRMASFRAVEEGVTLVRQTSFGLSAVYDAYGVPLATMDHFGSDDHVMVAAVPTVGVRTFYARCGDWLAWLALALAVALVVAAASRRAA